MYGEQINEIRMNMYLKVLIDIKSNELTKIAYEIIHDVKIRRMPLPADFLKYFNKSLDVTAEAILRLNKIKQAVLKFGYPNPTEAKEFLQDIWEDVKAIGGWMYLCTDKDCDLNNPTIYAQKRDLIKSNLEFKKITKIKETGSVNKRINNSDSKMIDGGSV